ncbi:MAG TPA: decaprenyl-phosphate phosphoribosyltransferase [Limnochordia bacterium]|nr:decaprenyl-phosphate phosphoribosyltransferase [Limnochordia bacterium]
MPTAPQIERPARRLGHPILRLLRPRQWVKNLFVAGPWIFAPAVHTWSGLTLTAAAIALFCATASAVYIINDLIDAPLDRQHPEKRRTRPLAAGEVSPATARTMAALLAGVALAGGFALNTRVGAVVAGYMALNLAYSLDLKHRPIVDLISISTGFVLRLIAGAQAIGVPISTWAVLCVGTLSLYLAANKRLQEMISHPGGETRGVLAVYTVPLLRKYVDLASNLTLLAYALFALTARPALAWSLPLVVVGIMRYAFLVERTDQGESPTDVVWSDGPLAALIVVWAGLCFYLVAHGGIDV